MTGPRRKSKRPSGFDRAQRLRALRIDDPVELLRVLEKAVRDRSPIVREVALSRLEEAEIREGLPLAESLLNDKRALVRSQAAVCVGTLLEGSGVAHDGLRRMLDDPEWVVRDDAQESLEVIGDKGALPLIERLLDDVEPVVRSHGATVVAALGGRRSKKLLRAKLAAEKSEHAQAGLLTGLFMVGEPNGLMPLLEHLRSSDYVVRCATAHYIERLDLSREERALVRKALRDAKRNALHRADESTMETVLKGLTSKRASSSRKQKTG
jgi:HEAT repeat protein